MTIERALVLQVVLDRYDYIEITSYFYSSAKIYWFSYNIGLSYRLFIY